MRFSKNSRAYTLIELLIVISVISVVFTVGFANYRNFGRRQQLISAVRQLTGDLRLAQEYALAGKKPDDCSSLTLQGYKVAINATSYSLSAMCSGSEYSISKDTITTIDGIELSSNLTGFTFKVLAKGTDLDTDMVITLTQTATNESRTITVSQKGDIQ